MTLDSIILGIINKRREDSVYTLNDDTHLRNDLGFDSIELAELTVRIESEFDIDVFEDGIVSTIGEILEKISK